MFIHQTVQYILKVAYQVYLQAVLIHALAFLWVLLGSLEERLAQPTPVWWQNDEIQYAFRSPGELYLFCLNNVLQGFLGQGFCEFIPIDNNVEQSFYSACLLCNLLLVIYQLLLYNSLNEKGDLRPTNKVLQFKLDLWNQCQVDFNFSQQLYKDIILELRQNSSHAEKSASYQLYFSDIQRSFADRKKKHKVKSLFEMLQISFPKYVMINQVIKGQFIDRVPIFQILTHQQKSQLYNKMEYVSKVQNSIINLQDYIYILLSGHTNIYYSPVNNLEQFNPHSSVLLNSVSAYDYRYLILGEEQFISD